MIRPPIKATSRAAIVRPSPVPPYLRVVEASSCSNARKIVPLLLGWNADAGVGDGETQADFSVGRGIAGDFDPHDHLAILGELDGIARQEVYADAHRELDRLLLPRVMEYARGSQHQAALLLGIARQTLRLKLRDLGLSITRPSEADEDDSG